MMYLALLLMAASAFCVALATDSVAWMWAVYLFGGSILTAIRATIEEG